MNITMPRMGDACCVAALSGAVLVDQVVYEWEQSLEELNVYIRPPPGVTASMILCEITANHVTLGLRGTNDKFLNVSMLVVAASQIGGKESLCGCVHVQHDLSSSVVVAESYWMLGASLDASVSLARVCSILIACICSYRCRPGRVDDQSAEDEERVDVAKRVCGSRRGRNV